MGYRRRTARFHVETGPAPLFERVHFKMEGPRQLGLHGPHVQERALERGAPLDRIRSFDSSDWELRTADVDVAKGKFVKSAWYRSMDGAGWWIVIGLGDVLMTVIDTDKFGLGPEVVRSGDLYRRVADVNAELMEAEATAQTDANDGPE